MSCGLVPRRNSGIRRWQLETVAPRFLYCGGLSPNGRLLAALSGEVRVYDGKPCSWSSY